MPSICYNNGGEEEKKRSPRVVFLLCLLPFLSSSLSLPPQREIAEGWKINGGGFGAAAAAVVEGRQWVSKMIEIIARSGAERGDSRAQEEFWCVCVCVGVEVLFTTQRDLLVPVGVTKKTNTKKTKPW